MSLMNLYLTLKVQLDLGESAYESQVEEGSFQPGNEYEGNARARLPSPGPGLGIRLLLQVTSFLSLLLSLVFSFYSVKEARLCSRD